MKRILLFLTVFVSMSNLNAQSLWSENFNSMTAGNLATDMTGATAGQNNWYYYADAGTPASFGTVQSVGANDNGLKITGSASASSGSNNPRFAFKEIDWTTRTSGNNILYVSYKMNSGPSSASTNTFRTVIYDTKGKMIIGLSYTKNTKELKAVLYDSIDNTTYGTFSAQLGGTSQTPAALTLTDNTIYDLALAYNQTTGIIYVFGQDMNGNVLFQQAYQRTYANSKLGNPSEFDTYVIAGTSNAASSYVIYDDIDVHANLCLFFDHKEDASFSYTGSSVCKSSNAFNPTQGDANVIGTFSSTAGISLTAGTGAVNLNSSTAGTYSVKFVTDGSTGCKDSSTVNITINDVPSTPTVAATGSTTVCQGTPVTINVQSPDNSITYTWSNSATGSSLNPSSTGTYTATATKNGCTSTASNGVAVTFNPAPTKPVISTSGATSFCQGGSVDLSYTPDNTSSYTWSNSANGTSQTITSSGTYTLTATANGCSTTSDAVVVTVGSAISAPTIAASGSTTVCQGNSVAINVQSPDNSATYTWSNSSIGSSLSATSTGTYTVVATKNGCSSAASNSVSVTINTAPTTPTVQAGGATTFCSGSSVTLSVSNIDNAASYLWSNSAVGTSTTVSTTGNYTVTVTKNSCSATSSATTVTVNTTPSAPVISANGSTSFCQGGSVGISVTSPANNTTYAWSNAANGTSITATSAGTFTATASANGCTSAASNGVTVTISNGSITTPVISTSGSTSICSGSTVTLSVTPDNNTTYTWSNNATGASISASSAGSYTVTATSNGCTATSSAVTVSVATGPTKPSITAFGNTTICEGNDVTLSVTPEANTTYAWSNNSTGNTVVASTSGYYAVTATKNGCTSTSNPITVTVNSIPAKPVVNVAGSSTACQGNSILLSVVPVNNTTYLWTNTATGNTATITSGGSYAVTATSNGCSNTSDAVTLTFNNCAGVEEVNSNEFSIYPNPADQFVVISLTNEMLGGTIAILSTDGKVVYTKAIQSLEEQLTIDTIVPGAYIVQLTNGTTKIASKLIIE